MSYAPILNPSAYTADREPVRQLAVQAAGILQMLATNPILFKTALDNIEQTAELHAPIQVREYLIEQLKNVNTVVTQEPWTWGDDRESGIESVRRYILAGRVELFAGPLAKP